MLNEHAMKDLFDLIIDNNPALTVAAGIDADSLKALASSLVSLFAGSRDEKDEEHGEFFLLQWPGADDQSHGVLPIVRARFLSRTCALDMAKSLNQTHPDAKIGQHFDVASVSWMVEYAQLLGKKSAS